MPPTRPVLDIANSIVAGNTADVDSDVHGAIAMSNGHNIFGSDVAGNIAGDRENIAASAIFAAIDPATGGGQLNADGIVPLRDSAGNPALSAADPFAAMPTDQLGHARPQPAGSLPDIGAAESSHALSTHHLGQQRRAHRHRRRQHHLRPGRRRPHLRAWPATTR